MDLVGNIRTITMKLKNWNLEVFGHIVRRKSLLALRIDKVQAALDQKCSRFLMDLECKLHVECGKFIDKEELF